MKYFHFNITCPECKEPHLKGEQLEKLDSKWIKCTSCGCVFSNKLVFDNERFPNTFEEVYRLNSSIPKKSASIINLPWAVESNLLEKCYIDWLGGLNPPNNILVTWPWKKVKFVPILIVEYLSKNEDKRVAVIDGMSEDTDRIIYPPTILKTYNETAFYKDNRELNTGGRDAVDEMKKIDYTDFIKLEKIVEYEIKRVGSKNRTKYTSDKSFIKCKNMILKEVKSDFGENCVKNLTINRLEKENKTTMINSEGKIDIKIHEMEKYAGTFIYDKRWLWGNLLNSAALVKARNEFPPVILSVDTAGNYSRDNRLFCLNEEDDPDFIFKKLEEIHPDLVILPNCDWFIKDKLRAGPRYHGLVKFLRQNNKSNVIMFTTNKDYRHLYDIYGTPFGEGSNVTTHTCDSEIFLNKLWETNAPRDKYYYNPLSSMWKEIRGMNKKGPPVKYIVVESLDEVSEKLSYLEGVSNQALKRDIIYFFRELLKSFLNLYGNPSSIDSFDRKGNSLDVLSYDSVLSMIREKTGESTYDEFVKTLSDLYLINGESPTNPLWLEAKRVLLNLLKTKVNIVTIVVHYRDLRGSLKLIRNLELSEIDTNRVRVATWKTLLNIESEIPPNYHHIILATSYPSIGYSIFNSKANEFIFLGASANIEKTKEVVNNRLIEIRSRPFKTLKEEVPAPEVIKKVNYAASAPIYDTIEEVVEDYVLRESNYLTSKNKTDGENIRYEEYAKIRAGEDAILVIDSMENGIFIPINSSLTVKEKDSLAEIELSSVKDKDLENTLVDKDILVDSEGLHQSFKALFIFYMRKYAESTVFRKGPYEWDGFEEIFIDSQRWINDLRRSVENYVLRKGVDEVAASYNISKYLSTLNLNAGDPDYIKNWWTDYELITLGESKYYIYRIEHPKSITDIQKMYEGITILFPDMDLDFVNGEKSYLASVFLQDFRRSLLTGKKLESELQFIHNQIRRDLSGLVKESALFKVMNCFKVKLESEVVQFKILDNYKDYIHTEFP